MRNERNNIFPVSYKCVCVINTQAARGVNTKKQSDGLTAVHELAHTLPHARTHAAGSNPVVCAEPFSVTGQHCSAMIFLTHVPRVRGQVVSAGLRSA